MDGRILSAKLRKLGLKAIEKHSTRIHGYNTYTKGDYRIYTEKSFGIYSNYKRKYVRKIDCTTESLPIIKDLLKELSEPILFEFGTELTIPS